VLVAGLVALALWRTPPSWLIESQRRAAVVLRWTQEHMFTVAGVSLIVGIVGLIVPFFMRRQERRSPAVEQRRDRDRQVMLNRVRNGWIKEVLDRSLSEETRLRLGLTRRPEVIAPPAILIRRSGQAGEPLPAGTSISTVFAELGGGLLILGPPGSGKTTALLELARDLLKDAEANQTQPIPVVFNLSSWESGDRRLASG
jgi:hypothetical protein